MVLLQKQKYKQKLFIQTGKENADMLTRQEKALATLALIQQKAAVQIGDLDRTQGFCKPIKISKCRA